MPGRTARVTTLVALVAGLACLVPAAQGRSDESLSLDVTFSYTGAISVTLPDGTPIGTTTGAPTMIPAGFYTVSLSQPGCTQMPYFQLVGPGVNILDNMQGGELTQENDDADFLPNSTYTWSSDQNPTVLYTFVTSANVVGTPPPPASSVLASTGSSGHSAKTVSNTGVVGSAVVPFRGTLTGVVSAAGSLGLAFNGKSVTHLTAGRYTVTVTDRSARSGFMLEKAKHAAVSVTGVSFVGKGSTSVDLTAGQWLFTTGVGKKSYAVLVR